MLHRAISAVLLASAIPSLAATLSDPPPRASLIQISVPDASGETTITGRAGTILPNRSVVCATLDTGHFTWALAAGDGSFQTRLFAPAGTSVLIKANTSPFMDRQLNSGVLTGLAGTIVRVPDPPSAAGEVRFAGAGLVYAGATPTPPWTFEGSIPKLTYAAGEAVTARGKLVIDSPAVAKAGDPRIEAMLALERLTGPDGTPTLAQSTYASTFLTPTGLPIERRVKILTSGRAVMLALSKPSARRLEAEVDVSLVMPPGALDGFYRPYIAFVFEGIPPEDPPERPILADPKGIDRAGRRPVDRRHFPTTMYLPIIRLGQPASPRMAWMLLTDVMSEGTRGVAALEDRERFAFSSRIVTQSKTFIIPRTDRFTGASMLYRLEPYAPALSIGDRGDLPNPPLIPLRFPSGNLRARIERPDGRVLEISPVPFSQSRSINAVTRSGRIFDGGGGHPTDPYQISTMDPRFETAFDLDGRYVVRLDGDVEDLWGNRWIGGGTYEFYVARALALDTAVLPGTPFEVGDSFDPGLMVLPPVPAEIELRVELVADSDRSRTLRHVRQGRANRFGRYDTDAIPLPVRGEYRIDVVATYRDPAGNLWMGSRTWGGVVAPRQSAIILHGERGTDDMPPPAPAWFFRRQTSSPIGSSHINYPFHSGDVVWAQKSDALIPKLGYQDPARVLVPLLASRSPELTGGHDTGDARLFSSTPDGIDPHMNPDRVDVWGYGYFSVQRPLVRVREIVGGVDLVGSYWRFSEFYGGQFGVGVNGDLPNEIKFQYGGAVFRGSALKEPLYAIYGSLFVLVPDDDPNGGSRVFPPFQGNGGGASGGPLFKLKGKEVDIFFHPTGVRPGTILELGNLASFAGQIGPTLPSKVEIVVTSPSEVTRTIRGQANKVGYFYQPGSDFRVYEEGVWRAKVKVFHDALTAAGQVTPPFPTGDVLGSREGEFFFYVVSSQSPQLGLSLMPRFVRPAEGPIAFTITSPAALTNLELFYTMVMPGFVLEEGVTSNLTYVYDALRLAKDFPNLDLMDADGFAGVDTVTISFLARGTDPTGARRHFARQIVIQGEELQMPEQPPTPPRRRAVRR